MTVHLNSHFRLPIKWLKRASSKEIKLALFASLAKDAGLRWRPLHKVQKHRPNRQVRRWVQLVALGGIEKWLGHRVQAIFGAFRLLLGGSTIVQLPLAKYEIYLTFSKSISV